MIDAVLINPGDRKQIFQDIGLDIAGVEPPFWIAVIASYLRQKGFNTVVIDANAENITPLKTAMKVKQLEPLLAVVIVYGSQPSASTQNMTAAGQICKEIKNNTEIKVAIGGLHPSALPKKTLEEENVDFVIDGEGPITIEKLLFAIKNKDDDYEKINGLWWSDENSNIKNTLRYPNIKNIDEILPPAAWDLLPMEKYRAHNWHCFDDINNREPYGAIYTSLGCPFGCVFCCINAPFGKPSIRYRNPEIVMKDIDTLVKDYGIKNIKFVDELFVLKEDHYMKIIDMIIEREYDLNIWVYARVDTVKPEVLFKMKKAGVNWFALGIESANLDVREGISKKMHVKDIKKVVRKIQESGIRVIGNYIFGLPDDNLETMNETLDMAIDLNCEFANFYSAMAYPGSRLYNIAIEKQWQLPEEWNGYSQHSFETLPLPTKYLSAKEVLEFRDKAFKKYFTNPDYLNMIEKKFGPNVKNHVQEITKIELRRKILENEE